VSVGNVLLLAEPGGDWRRIPLGQGGGIRRVVACKQAEGSALFMLAGGGIFASSDGGASWQTLHDELPVDHLLDIACTSAGLFALLSGGAVYSTGVASKERQNSQRKRERYGPLRCDHHWRRPGGQYHGGTDQALCSAFAHFAA
jgi:photosystem II stability/assembly factor-like uncharacterized protein